MSITSYRPSINDRVFLLSGQKAEIIGADKTQNPHVYTLRCPDDNHTWQCNRFAIVAVHHGKWFTVLHYHKRSVVTERPYKFPRSLVYGNVSEDRDTA